MKKVCTFNIRRQRKMSGFTFMELLVSTFISSVLAVALTDTMLSTMQIHYRDIVRTRVNQNVRSAFNIIATNARESGEYLPSTFPAIELTNGTSGASDKLTIRKGVTSAIPFLCQTLGTGASNRIYISSAAVGAPSQCVKANVTAFYNTVSAYRTANGGSVKAFIYDVASKNGEYFTYTGETDTGTEYYLVRNSGGWANTYNTASTSIYLIEELLFQRTGDLLEFIRNNDTANAQGVMFGLTDFQVTIGKKDNTTVNTFTRNDQWSNVKYISLTLSASETGMKKTYSRSLTTKVFPRNILAY